MVKSRRGGSAAAAAMVGSSCGLRCGEREEVGAEAGTSGGNIEVIGIKNINFGIEDTLNCIILFLFFF